MRTDSLFGGYWGLSDTSLTARHDSLLTTRGLVVGQTSGLGSYGLKVYSDFGSVPILIGADGATNKFIFPNGGGLTLGAVSGTGLYPIYLNSIYQGAVPFLSTGGNVTASGYVSGTFADFSTTRSDSGTYYGNKFQITFNPTYNNANVLNAATFSGIYASNSDSSSAVSAGLFEVTIDSNQYVGQVMAGRFDIKYNNTFAGGGNSLHGLKTGTEIRANTGLIGHMMGLKVEHPLYTGSLKPNIIDGIYIDRQYGTDTSSALHIAWPGIKNAISFGNMVAARTSRIYADSALEAKRIIIQSDSGVALHGSDTMTVSHANDTTFFSTTANTVCFSAFVCGEYIYAFGGFSDSTATVPVTKDSISSITNATNTLFNVGAAAGVTVAGDSAIILRKGLYKIEHSFSLAALNGKDFDLGMSKNSTAWIGAPEAITTTGATNFANCAGFCIGLLDSGDVIKPAVLGITDGTDPIFRSGEIYLQLKH